MRTDPQHCPHCGALTPPFQMRWLGRVRRDNSLFLFCVRRDIKLPRNYVIAENWRRFWRRCNFPA
jgi:hypothetical protein